MSWEFLKVGFGAACWRGADLMGQPHLHKVMPDLCGLCITRALASRPLDPVLFRGISTSERRHYLSRLACEIPFCRAASHDYITAEFRSPVDG